MALFHRLLRSHDACRLESVWRKGFTTTVLHPVRCVAHSGRKSITDAAPASLRNGDEPRTKTRKAEFPTRAKKASKWSHTPDKDFSKPVGYRNVENRRRRRDEPDGNRQRTSKWSHNPGKDSPEPIGRRNVENQRRRKDEPDGNRRRSRATSEGAWDARTPGDPEPWQVQKAALQKKFKEDKWQPRKRLSPDAIDGIRALHAQYPDKYTTPVLAAQFEVSPEAIRRILKSKWRPTEDEAASRSDRWHKRGEKIWTQMVELGVKPPKKWREMGIGKGRPHGGRRRTSGLDERARRVLPEGRLPRATSSSRDRGAPERTSLAERIL